MSKEAAVEKMVAHVDSWGGVDVIFNNAGIMHGDVSYSNSRIRAEEKIRSQKLRRWLIITVFLRTMKPPLRPMKSGI